MAQAVAPVPAPTRAGTTPAASPGPTTVVDLHGKCGDPAYADVVYVGRPMFQGGWRLYGHPLANPYRVGRDGDADLVVAKYELWLPTARNLQRHLDALRGHRLGCWCGPGKPCHARVIARFADAPRLPHIHRTRQPQERGEH
ncbi:MAG: DUF4326 domain-containing protein [Nocardioidaceae bacterium]|nr:DUF4326 domain-containing protein [Nocardioidaceae bacterium]NUT50567.1 DUF4326 domain-containing protein [Saccharothrix sp.]